MNFSIIANLKKLADAYRNFDYRQAGSYLRLIAEIFESGLNIADSFFAPTPVGATAEHAGMTDEELCLAIQGLPDASADSKVVTFNPLLISLAVELIRRVLERRK